MDPSILLGARGISLPDPMEQAQRYMTLGQLARARDMDAFNLSKAKRGDEAAAALEAALPQLLEAGLTPEAIAAAVRAQPKAGPAIVDTAEKLRKSRADAAKTEVETREKRVNMDHKALHDVGGVAAAEAQRAGPGSLERVKSVADFYGLKLPPMTGDPSDPSAVATYLGTLRDATISAKDQLANATTIRGQDQTATTAANSLAQRTEDTAASRALTETLARMNDATRREIAAGSQAQAAASREQAGATRDAANTQRITANEMKLADDYQKASKGWQETAGAIGKIHVALKTATTNPGSALSAGTAFMKILDPNSVVRESELGMALNASGWFDRALNVAQSMRSGRVMTPQQAANLGAAANDLFAEAAAMQRKIDANFEKRARDYGADPSRVIIDLGQREAAAPKADQAPPMKVGEAVGQLPVASSMPGAVFRRPDGKRVKSDGKNWVEVPG